jgi:ketosteroid isomerase-like protein
VRLRNRAKKMGTQPFMTRSQEKCNRQIARCIAAASQVIAAIPPSEKGTFVNIRVLAGFMAVVAGCAWTTVRATSGDEREVIAKLDSEFQAAVKIKDAQTMERILDKDMILVLGNGTINTREELLQEARDKNVTYEHQEEDPGTQTVRIWGGTAVVTAKLWVKGVNKGRAFDRRLWFSDTYVRTPKGWRYAFGQASLHLPEAGG